MTYNLNLVPGKVPVAVHVKQYDTAPREVTFNLYYGDAVYTIPSNVTITVSGTKPDGNGFAYNVTDFSGSTVTVPMQEQMTVLAGEIPCQLTIAQTSGVIGTATFTLCVEPAALSSDTPVSDTDLAAFQQMLTQTQQEAAGVAGATAQIATNTSNIAANAAAISSLNSKFSSNIGLYNPDTDNLSTSLNIISFRSVSYNNNTSAFGTSTDGGVLCKKAGFVKILGIVRTQNLNASDVVNVAAGIYRNGSWVTESYGFRASGATTITNVAAAVMNVQANDIVYLRVANETASRGKLAGGSVIWVNYV